MADSTSCPYCHHELPLPAADNGDSIRCPACAKVVALGAPTNVTAQPPSAPATSRGVVRLGKVTAFVLDHAQAAVRLGTLGVEADGAMEGSDGALQVARV
jgi:hypothetical protein